MVVLVLATLLAALLIDPVAQSPAYHRFADTRTMFGIPHFWNVVTNIPFLIIGAAGMVMLRRAKPPGGLPELNTIYVTVFFGLVLIGAGSIYYHLAPTNGTLVWDRFAIAIVFMALFSAIVGENVSIRLGKGLAAPLVVIGMISVLYWYVTETYGRGDLRPYALVQVLPMLLIPLILITCSSRLKGNHYLWWMLLAYVGAKVVEHFDAAIYDVLGAISGHSLKHLVAAAGAYMFYLAIRRRTIR